MHHGLTEDTATGTPRGGTLSPLPANVAPTALAEHFHGQWHTRTGSAYQRETRRKTGQGNRRLAGWAACFRHGAAERTFNAIWLRREHRLLGSQLRNRCGQGRRFASGGMVFLGA